MNLQRNPGARWCGVVMLIRPDESKLSYGEKPLALVVSKRDLELDGRRAVRTQVDYELVRKFFRSEDGDACEVYAELIETSPGTHHIEFVERASKRDFFLHVPQVSRSVPAH